MVHQTSTYRIMLTGLFALLLLFSCKKEDKKNPISFSIRATLPAIGDGLKGVKYKVVETYYKSGMFSVWGEDEVTGWELSGETDKYGKADVTFLPKKKAGYYYTIYFDYSSVVVPPDYGEYTVIGPSYDHINKGDDSDNQYDIRVLPLTGMHFKVKNVNCFDENDFMRFKTQNIDAYPQYTFTNDNTWGGVGFNGCYTSNGFPKDHVTGGHQVYLIEVTRNGQVTTHIDTFNLLPNVMNEVLIEY